MYQKLVLLWGFIFSLQLHFALFYWLSGDTQVEKAKNLQESSTVISLCVPPKKEIKKEVKKEIQPKAKKKRKPKLKTLAKEKKKLVKEVFKESSFVPQETLKPKMSTDEDEAQKRIFLEMLRETIKKNKTYPKIARIRAIQGEVHVIFYVLADGSLVKVDIVSGKKIFYSAIEEAIKKSSQLVTAPDSFIYPLKVNLRIDFLLR